MSIESIAIALNHSRAKGTAKLVLLGIANHDGDGGAWPSVGTLARYANVSRQNVQKALVALEGLGEIRRHVSQGGDHNTADYHRPNLYEITLRCPQTCDRTKNHRTQSALEIAPDYPASVARPPLVSEAPPASLARPKPSLNPTTKYTETNSSYRAREIQTCENGHPIIAESGGGVPFCALGCTPTRALAS